MAWKPLETRPHHVSGARGDSGADASHRQCRHGWTQTKKQPGKGPQNPRKVKEHSQLQAKRAYPTAGKELEVLVIKHSAIEKIVEISKFGRMKSSNHSKQCRDSDSPTGSILDSNDERSCAKQQ